jgi:hypothetical protein
MFERQKQHQSLRGVIEGPFWLTSAQLCVLCVCRLAADPARVELQSSFGYLNWLD